jgi:ComF family protein
MVYKWLKSIQTRLFPPQCRLCLAPGYGDLELCTGCEADLPWLPAGCPRCALPLAPEAADGGVCTTCRDAPPALDRCFALFSYQAPVDQWIQSLKFGRDLAAGRLLGQLLAARTPAAWRTSARLLPVPLHPGRLRQRGYNQAQEIVRPMQRCGWRRFPCDCRRARYTEAQSGLTEKHRQSNIRGAFSVGADLDGECIVLVDDVMTTGATLNELARTLKAAGAARVDACVVARALKHS